MNSAQRNSDIQELSRAFSLLKNEKETASFLRDLCTLSELQEMAKRWKAAQLLEKGNTIRAISEKTGLSTTTVSRVKQWKEQVGKGGYDLLLSRLSS